MLTTASPNCLVIIDDSLQHIMLDAGFSSLSESSDSHQHTFDRPVHELNGGEEFDINVQLFGESLNIGGPQ